MKAIHKCSVTEVLLSWFLIVLPKSYVHIGVLHHIIFKYLYVGPYFDIITREVWIEKDFWAAYLLQFMAFSVHRIYKIMCGH